MNTYQINTQGIRDVNIIFTNIISYKDDILLGNNYNTTLTVEVISENHYSGKSNFILDIVNLEKFVYELYQINKNLTGETKLTDMGYGSSLYIKIDSTGKIIIKGNLFDEHKEQALKFMFNIDQTYIGEMSENLYRDIVLEKKQIK